MKPTDWRRAFTLVELLVVVAVVRILAGLLLPAVHHALQTGKAIQCVSNLSQWNLALAIHQSENDDAIPRRGQGVQPLFILDRPEDWFNALPALVELPGYGKLSAEGRIPGPGAKSIFVCPSAKATAHTNFLSYAMNIYLSPWTRPAPHRAGAISRPNTLAVLADGPGAYSSTAPSINEYCVSARHVQRANISFLDGHVQSFARKYLGCGVGEPVRPDIHWPTETSGPNQAPVP